MPESELFEKFNRVFEPDDMIFCEHEPGKVMYLISSGQVKICKIAKSFEIVLALLGPGDIIGEMAIIDSKPRSAIAIATERTEVMVLTRDNFEQILAKKPDFLVKLVQILCDRIWFTSHQIQNLSVKLAQGKIAGMLVLLAETHKKKPEQYNDISLNTSIKDVSQMTGVEVGEAEGIIKELEKKDLIKVENGLIMVRNLKNIMADLEFCAKKERFKAF